MKTRVKTSQNEPWKPQKPHFHLIFWPLNQQPDQLQQATSIQAECSRDHKQYAKLNLHLIQVGCLTDRNDHISNINESELI